MKISHPEPPEAAYYWEKKILKISGLAYLIDQWVKETCAIFYQHKLHIKLTRYLFINSGI